MFFFNTLQETRLHYRNNAKYKELKPLVFVFKALADTVRQVMTKNKQMFY